MKLEYLSYLCETAKTGSISGAAENLNITHQGLNRALHALEEELNITLFETNNRGIRLTDQGTLLVETANEILSKWNGYLQQLTQIQSNLSLKSNISIKTTPGTLSFFLSNILQTFSTEYPNISLSLIEGDHVEIIDQLEEGTIDLGILGTQYTINETIFPEFYNTPNIVFVPLYQYKIFVLTSLNSPVAKYKSISIKTLLKYPIALSIQSGELEKDMTYRWLKMYGEPNIKFVTSSVSICNQIINRGDAVGVTSSKRHCGVNIPVEAGSTLIPLRDTDNTVTVGYLYNKEKPITPAMKAVINNLKAFCNRK